MTPVVYITFTLFLITLPDVEKDDHVMHLLRFKNQEDCLYFAHRLNQVKDPIAQKKQCRPVQSYTYPGEFL